LLLMIDRAEEQVGTPPEKTQTRLDNYAQQYSRQLDEPVTSLDSFVSEAQTTRYRLNKVYTSLNQTAEANKQRIVLAYGGLVTLIVLVSLAWGLYNTRFIKIGAGKPKAIFKPAAFVLIVLAFFVLPIFRVPAAEIVETTTEEQEAQGVLDTADRAASTADRAQARAWMLARLAAVWNDTDPAQAQSTLDEALAGIEQVDENNLALWGQSLAVQEASIGVPIDMEKADLIAADLNVARARLWSLPLIAIELNKIDPVRAVALLQAEQDALALKTGSYRDLQLRSVTLAWTEIQPSQTVPAVSAIDDAAIRSWTLRELAIILDDSSLFDPAVEAAREIEDPVQRARALREIAVSSGDKVLFAEALDALDGITGAQLAFALSDLAAASGDTTMVARIPEAYPDARIAALLRLGEYGTALRLSVSIVDPYERARARAAIASASEDAEAAGQIEIPLYRDLALRDVIRKTGNATLTGSIQSAYYNVQALTTLGEYDAALEIADQLGDSYPLVELVSALAGEDTQAALLLVEKMSRESDKAVALQIIAAVTNDQTHFEQAQGMALAARIQGDALAPAQASLDLANLFWEVNAPNARSALLQAYEAAQRISIK